MIAFLYRTSVYTEPLNLVLVGMTGLFSPFTDSHFFCLLLLMVTAGFFYNSVQVVFPPSTEIRCVPALSPSSSLLPLLPQFAFFDEVYCVIASNCPNIFFGLIPLCVWGISLFKIPTVLISMLLLSSGFISENKVEPNYDSCSALKGLLCLRPLYLHSSPECFQPMGYFLTMIALFRGHPYPSKLEDGGCPSDIHKLLSVMGCFRKIFWWLDWNNIIALVHGSPFPWALKISGCIPLWRQCAFEHMGIYFAVLFTYKPSHRALGPKQGPQTDVHIPKAHLPPVAANNLRHLSHLLEIFCDTVSLSLPKQVGCISH